jgi:hypothetical protein
VLLVDAFIGFSTLKMVSIRSSETSYTSNRLQVVTYSQSRQASTHPTGIVLILTEFCVNGDGKLGFYNSMNYRHHDLKCKSDLRALPVPCSSLMLDEAEVIPSNCMRSDTAFVKRQISAMHELLEGRGAVAVKRGGGRILL